MGSLTELTPKPMLKVAGKNLIEHKLDALPSNIDEVVIIVGYLGSEIQKYFGGEYKGRRLLYVEQEQARGTADALWQAKDILHDQFLVLNGDDLYAQADLIRCMVHQDGWYLLVQDAPDSYSGGIVEVVEDSIISGIAEGSHDHAGGKACMNVYLLDTRVFAAPLVPKAAGSTEYGLPQTVLAAAQQMHIPFRTEKADFLIQITSPEDLARAQVLLSK